MLHFISDSFAFTERADGTTLYTSKTNGEPLEGSVELPFSTSKLYGDVYGSALTYKISGRLVRGLPDGRWRTTFYDTASNAYTETYRLGVLHGPFAALDSAGRPLYRTTFVNGTGYFKRYYRTGQVAYEVLYRRNVPHGWALSYAADGKLIAEALYQNGHEVRRIEHGAVK